MLVTKTSRVIRGVVEIVESVDLESFRREISGYGYGEVSDSEVQSVLDYMVDYDYRFDSSRDIEHVVECVLGEPGEPR